MRPGSLGCLTVLLGLMASACNSGDEGNDKVDGGVDAGLADAGFGDPNTLVGTFQVKLVAPVPATPDTEAVPGFTTVFGKVYDGPTPSTLIWDEAQAQGECRLLTPRVPFCNTPCGGSAACVADDTCQPYPTAHGVGTVTVTGLHDASGPVVLEMRPVANNYQNPAGVELPYPSFAEGEVLQLSAAGGDYPPFQVQARGIAPFALTTTNFNLVAGQPLTLSWTPAADPNASQIVVKLDISHHGGTKGKIECVAQDDGALELPASMVGALLNLGVAGFPSVIVTRRAVGSVTIATGRIDLAVSAEDERAVTIDGLVSCTDDSECDNGQTCQPDLTCR